MRRKHANSWKPPRNHDPASWLIVDNFAGGGGASTGIKIAVGRDPDAGINHNAEALAMYAANHPESRIYKTSVWETDPRVVVRNRKVGLAHFSPDCTDFSKAKGGKPKRDKSRKSRALAWVVVKWARRVRPRVITLENVEEWLTWGPLRIKRHKNGQPVRDKKTGEILYEPDPTKRGQMFAKWLRQLEKLGYHVEWCELRGCDYGSPTIRKRLFVIARCDGEPIVWPLPTHREPESPWVKSGICSPWRAAKEIIDWTLPCPSIFMTKKEAKKYRKETGIIVKRPLKPNTMKRIATGTFRYVINCQNPFIVVANHGGEWFRGQGVNLPYPTITCSRDAVGVVDATLAPFVTAGQHGGFNRSVDSSIHTITASPKDQNCLVAPFCVPRYGEAPGQEPRSRSVEIPVPTIVPTGNGAQLIAPLLECQYGNSSGASVQSPAPTVMPGGGGKHALIAPVLDSYHGPRPDGSIGRSSELNEPIRTQDTSNRHALVSAFLAQHNTGMVGHHPDESVSTITGNGSQQNVVAAYMAQHNGNTIGYPVDDPTGTLTRRSTQHQVVSAFLSEQRGSNKTASGGDMAEPTAGGNHHAAVMAFLAKYYSEGGQWQDLREPTHTITTTERLGLVTVNHVEYMIVDIGMRMLTARELFNAQGFPPDYKIDVWCNDRRNFETGKPLKPGFLTKEAQVRCVGNSVCPQIMTAIVRANCPYLLMEHASPEAKRRRRQKQLELAI